MRVPVLFQRSQRPFLCAHCSFEFMIEAIHPVFIFARDRAGLFPAQFGDVVEMALHLIEQPLAVITFLRHDSQYLTEERAIRVRETNHSRGFV